MRRRILLRAGSMRMVCRSLPCSLWTTLARHALLIRAARTASIAPQLRECTMSGRSAANSFANCAISTLPFAGFRFRQTMRAPQFSASKLPGSTVQITCSNRLESSAAHKRRSVSSVPPVPKRLTTCMIRTRSANVMLLSTTTQTCTQLVSLLARTIMVAASAITQSRLRVFIYIRVVCCQHVPILFV